MKKSLLPLWFSFGFRPLLCLMWAVTASIFISETFIFLSTTIIMWLGGVNRPATVEKPHEWPGEGFSPLRIFFNTPLRTKFFALKSNDCLFYSKFFYSKSTTFLKSVLFKNHKNIFEVYFFDCSSCNCNRVIKEESSFDRFHVFSASR